MYFSRIIWAGLMTTSKHFYSYHSHIKEILLFCWADMPYVQYMYMYMYMHVGGSTERSQLYHAYTVNASWIPFLVGNLRVS